MNKIINYIKEKQKEYHEGSPAYNVLRALEVELPSLFEPSEHNPPVDPLSVRADAVYNKRRTEDERNFERVKELLSEPLNVKGATAEKNTILSKHLGDERIDKQSIRYAVYNAMQEHAILQRNEAIQECIEAVDNFIHGQIQSSKLWDSKDALIEHIQKKLKK